MESAGQQHPGFGIGQLGHQRHGQRCRFNQRQRRRQLVLGGFARRTGRPFGGIGHHRQPLALRAAGVGVDSHRAGHHRAAGQRGVERLPGQVVAHMQPVQPVGGLIGPGTQQQGRGEQQREGDDHDPRDQLTPLVASLSPASGRCPQPAVM